MAQKRRLLWGLADKPGKSFSLSCADLRNVSEVVHRNRNGSPAYDFRGLIRILTKDH